MGHFFELVEEINPPPIQVSRGPNGCYITVRRDVAARIGSAIELLSIEGEGPVESPGKAGDEVIVVDFIE